MNPQSFQMIIYLNKSLYLLLHMDYINRIYKGPWKVLGWVNWAANNTTLDLDEDGVRNSLLPFLQLPFSVACFQV